MNFRSLKQAPIQFGTSAMHVTTLVISCLIQAKNKIFLFLMWKLEYFRSCFVILRLFYPCVICFLKALFTCGDGGEGVFVHYIIVRFALYSMWDFSLSFTSLCSNV